MQRRNKTSIPFDEFNETDSKITVFNVYCYVKNTKKISNIYNIYYINIIKM